MSMDEYLRCRPHMKPGDIIAFSGKDPVSRLVKWAMKSTVSHVGMVFQTKIVLDGTAQDGVIVDCIESLPFYKDPQSGKMKAGVMRTRMSDHMRNFDGNIWWLPLHDQFRTRLNFPVLVNFLLHSEGTPFDFQQTFFAGMDELDKMGISKNKEDYSKLYCAELATAAFKAAGGINRINASEVTPFDICTFKIFKESYAQLKGPQTVIKSYNSVHPEGFGV